VDFRDLRNWSAILNTEALRPPRWSGTRAEDCRFLIVQGVGKYDFITAALVVDDEPDVEALILQRFRHKMRGEAVSFLFARDGVEALAALKANGNIDLVVTDINMPRMDGLSLLQKLFPLKSTKVVNTVNQETHQKTPCSWPAVVLNRRFNFNHSFENEEEMGNVAEYAIAKSVPQHGGARQRDWGLLLSYQWGHAAEPRMPQVR
jgi:CheY-like chemotaxis protein